jgi:hypothetical protein
MCLGPPKPLLDAFLTLRREHDLRLNNVVRIVVRLPEEAAGVVDNSPMPDVIDRIASPGPN